MIFDQYLRLVNSVNNKARSKTSTLQDPGQFVLFQDCRLLPAFWSQFSLQRDSGNRTIATTEKADLSYPSPFLHTLTYVLYLQLVYFCFCVNFQQVFSSQICPLETSAFISMNICEYVPNCTIHSLSPSIALLNSDLHTQAEKEHGWKWYFLVPMKVPLFSLLRHEAHYPTGKFLLILFKSINNLQKSFLMN